MTIKDKTFHGCRKMTSNVCFSRQGSKKALAQRDALPRAEQTLTLPFEV